MSLLTSVDDKRVTYEMLMEIHLHAIDENMHEAPFYST